jgi:hypothetical protein
MNQEVFKLLYKRLRESIHRVDAFEAITRWTEIKPRRTVHTMLQSKCL